jgi:fructosamine-3-kinase
MDPYANEKDFGLKMANLLKRMNKTNFLSDELYKEFYQSRKHLLKQKDKFEIDLRQFRQQIDEHIDEELADAKSVYIRNNRVHRDLYSKISRLDLDVCDN